MNPSVPASFNGVYGFRPTVEVVSYRGHIPPVPGEINGMRHMAVAGPLARSIDDLEFILPLIAGPGDGDHHTAPLPPPTREGVSAKELRIAWMDHFGDIATDESTRLAMRSLVAKLQAAGATVVQAEPPNSIWRLVVIWTNSRSTICPSRSGISRCPTGSQPPHLRLFFL